MNPITLFKKSYKAVAIITAIAFLLLLLCFMFSFDAENGYLSNGILTTLFFIVYAVGAIISLLSLLIPSEFDIIETPDTLNTRAKSCYTMATAAAVLVGGLSIFLSESVSNPKNLLFSGIGIIYFGIYMISVVKTGYEFNIFKLVFLFFSIATPIVIALGNNTNYYHHINSTENTLSVLFSISFLMFVLQEAKRICTHHHSGWHFVSMLLTCMSGLSLSGAYITAYVFDVVNEGYRFYQMLIIFIISAAVAFKLHRFISELTLTSKYKKQPTKENE